MAYQIQYDISGNMKRRSTRWHWLKYAACALLALATFAGLFRMANDDWAITVSALERMAEDIGHGSGLQEAFSDFCLDILQGAHSG